MCKNSCLNCKHYKREETKVVGRELVCNGVMSVPVYKVFPRHCETNQEYFEKWWKENSNKTTRDDDYVEPVCYEDADFIKPLKEMKRIMEDILENIETKKKTEI